MDNNTPNIWSGFKGVEGRCKLILAVMWDPIGILNYPGALGQYDKYAAEVAILLVNGAAIGEIEEYLLKIQTQRLEVKLDFKRLANVLRALESLQATLSQFE